VGVDAGLRRRHEKRVIHADDLVGIVIIELDRLIHFHTPPCNDWERPPASRELARRFSRNF
jgi:hypothetical protein